MHLMPNTTPTFPKGTSQGQQGQRSVPLHKAGLSVQPWLNSCSIVPRDGSLRTGQLPTAMTTRRALSHTPWPQQSHERSLLCAWADPKARPDTAPHTYCSPCHSWKTTFPPAAESFQPSNPKRSCSQHWFPSKNTSLPQLFSFFVSLKCQWWLNNNEALRGERFTAMITAGKVPLVFLGTSKTGNDVGSRRK